MLSDRHLDLLALQELDHLAIGAGDEGDANVHRRVFSEAASIGFDAGGSAGGEGAGVGGIGVGGAEAEMQQGAFGAVLASRAAPAFGLNVRVLAEDFDEAAVPSIEEGGAIDAAGDGEGEMQLETQALGVEFDRRIEIHGADGDVVEAIAGCQGLHVGSVFSPPAGKARRGPV